MTMLPLRGWLKVRILIAILVFLGMVVNYMLRVNLAIAIVDMTISEEDGDNTTSATNSSNSQDSYQRFSWSSGEKAWILSAFFYGYILLQIPGGNYPIQFSS